MGTEWLDKCSCFDCIQSKNTPQQFWLSMLGNLSNTMNCHYTWWLRGFCNFTLKYENSMKPRCGRYFHLLKLLTEYGVMIIKVGSITHVYQTEKAVPAMQWISIVGGLVAWVSLLKSAGFLSWILPLSVSWSVKTSALKYELKTDGIKMFQISLASVATAATGWVVVHWTKRRDRNISLPAPTFCCRHHVKLLCLRRRHQSLYQTISQKIVFFLNRLKYNLQKVQMEICQKKFCVH